MNSKIVIINSRVFIIRQIIPTIRSENCLHRRDARPNPIATPTNNANINPGSIARGVIKKSQDG